MEDQELKWWHVRWRPALRVVSRIAIILGKIVGLLLLIAAVGYGALYLISPWLVSQRMKKIDRRVTLVPADLPTTAETPPSSASINCYGMRLPLPREGVVNAIQGDSVTFVRLRNGGSLTVENAAQSSGWLEIAIGEPHTQRLLGDDVLRSKFNLMQAAMWTTPDQAKWWRFRTLENQRVEYLLMAKFSLMSVSTSRYTFTLGPIYRIAAGDLRGFQIGNPVIAPYNAHLDLFDSADRHFRLDVTGPEGHGQVLSQADINGIVASIRPALDR